MLFASLLALAQSTSPEAPFVAPAHQWIVDYSQAACTLARRIGDEHSPIVAVNASVGYEPGELVVMDAGTVLDRQLRGPVQVRIDDGAPLTIQARRVWRNSHPIIKLSPVPHDFLERVAAGHQLTLARQHEVALTLDLPNAREAIEQLTRCNDDLLQSWGVDVATRRALSRQPRLRNIDWAVAMMPDNDANVIFMANISETGTPLDCRVVMSGMNQRVQNEFCDRMRRGARFEPALNAERQPVTAQYVTRLRWAVRSGVE